MLKVWGRASSSNVQKVMWAVTEIGLPHERIDIGGPFGKNREKAYLAMMPNGRCTIGSIAWLARRCIGQPELAVRSGAALAQKWMVCSSTE